MSNEPWQRTVVDGGRFEVWLPPGFLRTALRSVAYEARLALYRLVEDARRRFVDALPAPINRRVLHALREGGDPE